MTEILVPETLSEEELYSELEDHGISYTEVSRDNFIDELASGEYDGVIGNGNDRMYAAAVETDTEMVVFDYSDSGLATSYLSGNPSADASSIQEITQTYIQQSHLQEQAQFGAKMIRHDALNDLNVIRGRLDIAHSRAEEDVQDQLEIAEGAARSIEDIINSTKALFSTDTDSEPVPIHETVQHLKQQYGNEAKRRGFELEVDIQPGIYACAGDEIVNMYGQMIRNGFEHSGGDHIRVTAEETEEGPKIEYEDNGEGFDPDNMEKVLEEGVTENEEGGLGMFIMAQNAEKYDMDLILGESEDLGGAKITTILEPTEK